MEIKSNDKNSFDALYDAYAAKVYRVALYYSGDHHAAEDIMQSVFTKLCLNMENMSKEHIEAWVKTLAKNMALNYNRHLKFEADLPAEDMENLIDCTIHEESVETIFTYRCKNELCMELIKKIYEELYSKNLRWYEAVWLVYILEKPQKEVAEIMGVSVGALQLMLYRAKKWIRKQYQEQMDHLNEI